MSQSQIHKAKQALEKLEHLVAKTKRRIQNLQKEYLEQVKFLNDAYAKYDELTGDELCPTYPVEKEQNSSPSQSEETTLETTTTSTQEPI